MREEFQQIVNRLNGMRSWEREEGGREKHKQTIDYSHSSVTDNQTKLFCGVPSFSFHFKPLPEVHGWW